MSKLMILGAGGHGRVVAEIAELMGKWDEIVFLDDNKSIEKVNGYKVLGKISDYKIYKQYYSSAFVAIGNNMLRLKLLNELIKKGFEVPVLIHPFTFISNTAKIDLGTVIMAGSVVSSNVSIEKGVIINTSSSVDHDCKINEGVHISPGVSIGGTTCIGKNTWIGIGASISNNVNIGSNTIIASGGVINTSVKDNVIFGGVPGRFIKNNK